MFGLHEGRHYKKLFPYVAQHQKLLEEFLGDFWDFYWGVAYRQLPGGVWARGSGREVRFDACSPAKTEPKILGISTSGLGLISAGQNLQAC